MGSGTVVTSKAGYDAVGNKAFDEDLHGFRTEYRLDSLYRVILTRLPAVPGSTLSVATPSYEPTRRYDLVGNVVQEVDGNGQSTTRVFDFANRLLSVTDAVGRIEASTWDGNGNRLSQTQKQQGATGNHLTRTMTYDALNRPLDTTEVFSSGGSTPPQFR